MSHTRDLVRRWRAVRAIDRRSASLTRAMDGASPMQRDELRKIAARG